MSAQAARSSSRAPTWRRRRWRCCSDFEVVYAGKTPTEDDIVALCKRHDPVAIIVRYSKVGAAAMDAAPSPEVISKHGSGTDTIDKVAAKARGIEVVAAVGANAAAVAEQALALLLACAKSVVHAQRAHARRPLGQGHAQERRAGGPHGRRDRAWAPSACASRAWPMPWACACSASIPTPRTCRRTSSASTSPTIWRESDAISLHCPLTADNAKPAQRRDPGGVQARRDRRQHRARRPDRRGRAAGRRAVRSRSPAPASTASRSSR